MKRIYSAILGFLVFINLSYGQNKSLDTLRVRLNTNIPNRTCIKISNDSSGSVTFKLKFNDMVFSSDDELINYVRKIMPVEYKDEPDYRKLWRFLSQNLMIDKGIFDLKVYKSGPLMAINSLGWGHLTSALYYYWAKMGYKTRIWLVGHGDADQYYAEVFADDKWQMFNPFWGVYYLNDDNKVASVEELSKEPTLISQPRYKLPTASNAISFLMRYSNYTANSFSKDSIYITTELDNLPASDTFSITLPPHSTFEFPGIYTNVVKDTLLTPLFTDYLAEAKLKLPHHFTGDININLAVQSIKFKGVVTFNNNSSFPDIYSEQMQKFLDKNHEVFYHLGFTDGDSIEIIYFVNPQQFKMKKVNQLQLTGKNASQLKVKLDTLNPIDVVNDSIKMLESYRFYDENSNYCFYKQKFDNEKITSLDNFKINNKKEFFAKLKLYVNCLRNVSDENKAILYSRLKEKAEKAFKRLGRDFDFNDFYAALNHVPFVVFYLILEQHERDLPKLIYSLTKLGF